MAVAVSVPPSSSRRACQGDVMLPLKSRPVAELIERGDLEAERLMDRDIRRRLHRDCEPDRGRRGHIDRRRDRRGDALMLAASV